MAVAVLQGHAIAQPVSFWLPTAAAWVQAWVRPGGLCCGQVFFQVLWILLPIIPSTAPHASSSGAGTTGQNSGQTQSHPAPRKETVLPLIIIKNLIKMSDFNAEHFLKAFSCFELKKTPWPESASEL
jgi:hypothetical protein